MGNDNEADLIAAKCLEIYENLNAAGKPGVKEWTVLSAIVLENDNQYTVVSLGTGTKCIGNSEMSKDGVILNDSHAEVIARRAFLKYLYLEVHKVIQGKESTVLVQHESGIPTRLRPGVKFHMYSSQMPCGDASIDSGFSTGAKCLKDDPRQDLYLPGVGVTAHGLLAVRTKPGRGDRTLSVSCSDKLARWCYTGIQGALLTHLLYDRIFLNSIVIGNGCPFSKDSLRRAIERCPGGNTPRFLRTQISFPSSQFTNKSLKDPSPCALIWHLGIKKAQVSVNGIRLGTTKKNLARCYPVITKRALFTDFLESTQHPFKGLTYREVKSRALQYQQATNVFKATLGAWSTKPWDLEMFTEPKSCKKQKVS